MLAPQPFIPGQDSTFQRFCHSLFLLAWKSVFLLPAGSGIPGCVFRLSALLLCVLPSLIHPDLRDTLTEQDTLREPKCHGDPCKTGSLAQHSNTVLVLLILDNASCFKPLPFVVLAPIIDNGLIWDLANNTNTSCLLLRIDLVWTPLFFVSLLNLESYGGC